MSEPSKHAQACSISMPKISDYALLYKTLELIQQAWFCLHPKYWLLDVPSNAPHLPFLHPFIPPLEHLRGIEHIKKGKPRLSLLKGVAASLGNHRDTWCTSLSLSLFLFFIFLAKQTPISGYCNSVTAGKEFGTSHNLDTPPLITRQSHVTFWTDSKRQWPHSIKVVGEDFI